MINQTPKRILTMQGFMRFVFFTEHLLFFIDMDTMLR